MTRECGECVVCCIYHHIPILDKTAMEVCVNLKPLESTFKAKGCNSCKVYENRPVTCKMYNCAWLLGHGKEEDRPDKTHLVFDQSKRIENSLECKELKQGQSDTEEGREVIDRMSKSYETPVIVLSFFETRIKRLVGRGT